MAGPIVKVFQSRGPWLANRFCCPAGSSLTMASCAPLDPPAALCIRQPAFALRSALGWVPEGPQLTLCVCALRAVFRTPMDCAVACGCFFTAHAGLRRIRTGSASISPRSTVLAWTRHEAAKFPLWYGPMSWLALPRQGRFRSSFHPLSRLIETSNITTRANSQFPATGLSPARHTA